tara:strand:- start:51 stop:719 length:669 start_codon:yes stop_codon:yes gene_type:complete
MLNKKDFWELEKKGKGITNLAHYFPGKTSPVPMGIHWYQPDGIKKDHPLFKWVGRRQVAWDCGNRRFRFVSETDLEEPVFCEPLAHSKLLSIHNKFSVPAFISTYRKVLQRKTEGLLDDWKTKKTGSLEELIVACRYWKNNLPSLRTHIVSVNVEIASMIEQHNELTDSKADRKRRKALVNAAKLSGLGVAFRLPNRRSTQLELKGTEQEWLAVLNDPAFKP